MVKRWLFGLAIVYIVASLVNVIIHFEQLVEFASGRGVSVGGNRRYPISKNVPFIFVVTPTYFRSTQKADLIRLSQTLLHISRIHWIIIEDSPVKSEWIDKFLRRIKNLSNGRGFEYSHLNTPTPEKFKIRPKEPSWRAPRGVWQRNEALIYLRATPTHEGVVYFADDDNTYDLRLFDEIRTTKVVSIFPVGIVGGLFVEKPFVNQGKVIGFNAKFKPERTYPTDMAGFAVNLKLLKNKNLALFSENVARGFLETDFLEKILIGRHQLEPKANDCNEIYVWHTRTQKAKLNLENSNISINFND